METRQSRADYDKVGKNTDHCELGNSDGAVDGNVAVAETVVEGSVGAALLGRVVVPGAVFRTGRAVWLGPGTGMLMYESWKMSFCAPSGKL